MGVGFVGGAWSLRDAERRRSACGRAREARGGEESRRGPRGRPVEVHVMCDRNSRKERPQLSAVAAALRGAAFAAPLTSAAVHAGQVEEIVDNTKSLGITGVVFFLTFWGLISFVKGATKARIEQRNYTVAEDPSAIAAASAKHFMGRSYRINREADTRPGVVTFEGDVAPSTFLALLLVFSLAAGLSGLVVILNTLLPESYHSPLWWNLDWLSLLVAPWYWKGASRIEQVKMMIEESFDSPSANTVYIKGHRDELMEYEKALGYKRNEQPL